MRLPVLIIGMSLDNHRHVEFSVVCCPTYMFQLTILTEALITDSLIPVLSIDSLIPVFSIDSLIPVFSID